MSNNKIKNRIWILIGVLLGVAVLYFALVFPFVLNKQLSTKLEEEEQRLNNYIRLISQKPERDAALERIKYKEAKYKSMLLETDKPPVVAARLQNTLKKMAEEEGVNIISEKQLAIEERGLFIEIPVQINLSCSITKLTNLIYAIEDYRKFLDISDLSIRVINIRKPTDVRADMTVSGFIFAHHGISEES